MISEFFEWAGNALYWTLQYGIMAFLILGLIVGLLVGLLQWLSNRQLEKARQEQERLATPAFPVWSHDTEEPAVANEVVPVEPGPLTLQNSFSLKEQES